MKEREEDFQEDKDKEEFQPAVHSMQKRSQFSRPPKVKKMRMKNKAAKKTRKRNSRR